MVWLYIFSPHFSLQRNIICTFLAHTHDPSHCFIAFNQQSQGTIKQIRLVNSMGDFHNKLLLFFHSLQSHKSKAIHSAEQLIYHCGQPELGCMWSFSMLQDMDDNASCTACRKMVTEATAVHFSKLLFNYRKVLMWLRSSYRPFNRATTRTNATTWSLVGEF